MAEQNDFERTESASPRRLEQARERGQVARSQELTTFAMLIAGAAGLWFTGTYAFQRLGALLRAALTLDADSVLDPTRMAMRLNELAADAFIAVAPLMAVLMLVAMVAPQLLSGWLFSWEALRFDFNRIDPLAGLQRLLSMRGAVELGKALLKAALVTGVAIILILHYREPLQALVLMPLDAGIGAATRMVGLGFLAIAATFALIAAVDVPYQLWRYADDLKMSRQELRQEQKESEGDPQIKAAIRAQQREIARRRMMAEIPKASVVVTNPTHYAVALRYDDQSMYAPRVVAKGAGTVAAKIREMAAAHHIPMLEAPPLARALYRHTEIGDEIPKALYTAVAEVLAYVFQLRINVSRGAPAPQQPRDITVPPEFVVEERTQ